MKRIVLVLLMLIAPATSWAQNINGAYTQFPGSTTPPVPTHTALARAQDATMATDYCTSNEQTGVSDATACLQNAVTALCGRSGVAGGQLYIPAGTYNVSGTISVACNGISIIGAGQGDRTAPNGHGTTINVASTPSPSASVFSVNIPNAYGLSFTMRSMLIYSGDGKRTGAFLDMAHFGNVNIEDMAFYQSCTAIKISGGNTYNILNTRVDSPAASNCDAIYLTGAVSAPYQQLDTVTFSHVAVSTGSGGNCYRAVDFVHTIQ